MLQLRQRQIARDEHHAGTPVRGRPFLKLDGRMEDVLHAVDDERLFKMVRYRDDTLDAQHLFSPHRGQKLQPIAK